MTKVHIANQVLASFTVLQIDHKSNGIYVSWPDYRGGMVTRRWQCRGNSFYPVWHNKLPCGGTATIALSQLVRWVQEKTILPLRTWHYWASERCHLLKASKVALLEEAGYPVRVNCVLCGNVIENGLDWWYLKKVQGPCCADWSGCKQQVSNRF